MLEVGRRYESSRTGGWIQITRRTPERLVFERLIKPGTGRTDPHLHRDFVQTWECVSGSGGAIDVEGEQRELRPGDRVQLPLDTAHRDPYNPGEGEVVVRATFDPDTDFIEAYAAAWAHHMNQGTVNDQDEMPLLQIFALIDGTDGESYRAGIPIALQKASLPLMKRIAHLRGYEASYDEPLGDRP
jgi:mannose-6-phosphate isomerase-like protein (cupin superfamily)